MHVEVQVALNFVISYLYNKLPRRRVNIFGEELEKALKEKFSGHWYPGKPLKGSAFRCLKTGDPIDPVLEIAARESGVAIQDVLENLPSELAVWVDPGEVSYRIGEKGDVKILYRESWDRKPAAPLSSNAGPLDMTPPTDVASSHAITAAMDREVHKTFNPEARVFRPVEVCLSNLSLGGGGGPSGSDDRSSSPSPTKGSPTFLPRTTQPLTFTTASFAQTKFGSTKLKTNSKRTNRMSPTEFSNYIKQRALLQQAHNNHPPPPSYLHSPGGNSPHYNSSSRSLSPSYYFSQATPLPHHHSSPQIPFQGHAQGQSQGQPSANQSNSYFSQRWSQVDSEPSSPYHHLLVAN